VIRISDLILGAHLVMRLENTHRSKERKRFLTGAALLALILAGVLVGMNREPRFEGKPFSYWLKQAGEMQGVDDHPRDERFLKPFRSFGKEGVDRLLVAAYPSHVSGRYWKFYSQTLPQKWRRLFPVPNASTAEAAIEILVLLKPPADWVLPTISAKFHHPRADYRRASLWLLHCLGEDAQRATPLLREVLRSNDQADRHLALSTVSDLGVKASGVLPELERLLDTDAASRVSVVLAIGSMGPAAHPLLPKLVASMNDAMPYREKAQTAQTILRLDPDQTAALDFFRVNLTTNIPGNLHAVLTQLPQLGRAATNFVPDLLLLLRDADPKSEDWMSLVWTLRHIGGPPDALLPFLNEEIRSATGQRRYGLAVLIYRFDPGNEEAERILTARGLTSEKKFLLIQLLAESGCQNALAKTRLEKLLQDPDPNVRAAAKHAVTVVSAKK